MKTETVVKPTSTNVTLSLRFPPELIAQMRAKAEQEKRSVNSLVVLTLDNMFKPQVANA